ncbi:hypothetical protein GCK72_015397 [Caenorhabditis remanei]|uniref:Uncharacterized protein n=1 Tax=Caenorhabditis remanei TaxID=31234 RepID=A0A6A5GUT7_CAERE|nr:hypothetical protein GCK72_015397 [Caenorhabditis remanei]KAF1758937.1 hypothetical protein GCK72_015397 [Caenorhabditis remanei]
MHISIPDESLGSDFRSSHGVGRPETSTGIEHAEKARQVAGGKPDWSLYKCDDYLKFDKYSYAHAEITMNKSRVPQPTNRKADVLPKVRA